MNSIPTKILLATASLATAAGIGWTAQAPVPPEALQVRPYFVALSVKSVQESADWYRRVLGFQTVRSMEVERLQAKFRILKREGALLELVEIADARNLGEVAPDIGRRQYLRGVFKFGFQVADLDEALAQLSELGVELRGRVVTEPDESMRSAQIVDPDGNILQLFQILE